MSGCLLTDHLSFIRGHHWALSAVLGRFQRHSQWGRTCGPRTFRGIWSLLHVFGVTVTEAISSKLSSANCLSDIDVVGDSQFLIVEECRLSELRRTEAESNKNSCHSYIHELSKRIQAFFNVSTDSTISPEEWTHTGHLSAVRWWAAPLRGCSVWPPLPHWRWCLPGWCCSGKLGDHLQGKVTVEYCWSPTKSKWAMTLDGPLSLGRSLKPSKTLVNVSC